MIQNNKTSPPPYSRQFGRVCTKKFSKSMAKIMEYTSVDGDGWMHTTIEIYWLNNWERVQHKLQALGELFNSSHDLIIIEI